MIVSSTCRLLLQLSMSYLVHVVLARQLSHKVISKEISMINLFKDLPKMTQVLELAISLICYVDC